MDGFMRMYRLGDDVNTEGWPFLYERHAYLADGTPIWPTARL
jgi:hypothetical protein